MNDFLDFPDDESTEACELKREGRASRFRFSLTRLIIATTMAPLPLLIVDEWNQELGWFFGVSSLAFAGSILFLRASDLPRLNFALQMILPVSSLFLCFFCFGNPFVPVLGGVDGAFWLAYILFPQTSDVTQSDPSTLSVWLTGVAPFCLFTMIAIYFAFGRRNPGELSREQLATGLVLPSIFLALTAVNLYWIVTDPDDPLDENPTRAYLYELTLIAMPVATLCGLWKWL